jgi:hypothetical protein
MELGIFFIPWFLPLVHWCMVAGSWHTAKYFTLNEFIKSDELLSNWHKFFIFLFILFPASVFSMILSVFFANDILNPSLYIAIVSPALLSCWWHMSKQQKVAYEIARKKYLTKEELEFFDRK